MLAVAISVAGGEIEYSLSSGGLYVCAFSYGAASYILSCRARLTCVFGSDVLAHDAGVGGCERSGGGERAGIDGVQNLWPARQLRGCARSSPDRGGSQETALRGGGGAKNVAAAGGEIALSGMEKVRPAEELVRK